MKRPLNIAHRGGAGLWPENTLTAFREAARAGFDGAELDVQLTRDGQLVAFHDFIPSARTCRGPAAAPPRPICEWTTAELQRLDVGRGDAPERIPLLEEIIAEVGAIRSDFLLFIELKTALHDHRLSKAPEAVADAIVAVLRATKFEKRAVLVGFDWAGLIHAKRIAPEIKCWFTTLPPQDALGKDESLWSGGFPPAKFEGSVVRAIKAAGGDGWLAHHEEAGLEEGQALGLKTGIWTVNDEAKFKGALRRSVDAIVTDRPDRLQRLIKDLRTTPSTDSVRRRRE